MIARGQCLCVENLYRYLKGMDGLYWQHDSTDNEELLFKVISTSWH